MRHSPSATLSGWKYSFLLSTGEKEKEKKKGREEGNFCKS
jgi:hypothetical protein